MPTLPIALSLPHAGLEVPVEVRHLCRLSPEEIRKDGDEGSRQIAGVLRPFLASFVATPIARAFVDLNREEHDISRDGVVKTHTCWNVPIYMQPLSAELIETLIATYHRPWHHRLSGFATHPAIRLAIDLHTMAPHAPPVAPDPGTRRPRLCIGNDHHRAAPRAWVETLAELAARYVDPDVTINTPFAGGWITRSHGREMPWVQLEISREPWLPAEAKGQAILELLRRCAEALFL